MEVRIEKGRRCAGSMKEEIILEKLNKAYGDQKVLCDLSARIPIGSRFVIMGESGCGKTTLLRLIMGLEPADSGRILNLPARKSAVFQEDRLCEAFRAEANIRLAAEKGCPPQKILEHLAELKLSGENLEKPVGEFSGGMKRRTALARAILHGGDLILLDEPFAGLDEEMRELAMQYILKYTAGKTVILVTHDKTVAGRFGGTDLNMEAPKQENNV